MRLISINFCTALVKIWNYIFNPTFGFVNIWPKFVLKQPSIV